jgi:hypothetical protein
MQSGAVLGYIGLVSGLLTALRGELVERSPAGSRLTVIATGGHTYQPLLSEVPGIDVVRRQVEQADAKVICLLRTNLLGIPPLQLGQVDQGVVGTYHAEDVRPDKLPGVLDELLKPTPRLLHLLDRGQPRCTGLVFGELGADQVKHRGHSFPNLDTVGLPGVPILDQLVEVLLSINFKHYDKISQARSQYKHTA